MKRILLIDDSLIQHRILGVLLHGRYELMTAASGIEGIRIAKNKRPDLILLDYDMPFLSGKETFQKLQDQPETRSIPVVFLTGVDEREDVEEVLKLKPQGYVLKPVDQNTLFERIRKVLPE